MGMSDGLDYFASPRSAKAKKFWLPKHAPALFCVGNRLAVLDATELVFIEPVGRIYAADTGMSNSSTSVTLVDFFVLIPAQLQFGRRLAQIQPWNITFL
jgi:hypothetical protein